MVRRHGEACSCFEQRLVTLELFRFIYSNTGSSAMAVSCNMCYHNCSPWFKEKRFALVAFLFILCFLLEKIFLSSLKLQQFPQGFEGLTKMFEMAYLLVIKGVYADMHICTHTLMYIKYCMSSTSSLLSCICVSLHECKHICMYFTLLKGELCHFNCLD